MRRGDFPMTIKQVGMQGMRVVVLALCALTVSAHPVLAQDSGPGMGGGNRPDQAQMAARRLETMTKELNLTTDQVAQVKAINDAALTEMVTLRNDSTMSREDKRGKMMTMRKNVEDKIRDVLTEEQKPKYDAMLAERRQRMGRRQSAPPPPQ
jgi:Spy/CpxP family protein refolding chaperone